MVRQWIKSIVNCLADLLSRGDVAAKYEREKLGQIRLEHEGHLRSDKKQRDIIDRIHSDESLVQHIRDQDRQLEQYFFHESEARRANECAAVDSQSS